MVGPIAESSKTERNSASLSVSAASAALRASMSSIWASSSVARPSSPRTPAMFSQPQGVEPSARR